MDLDRALLADAEGTVSGLVFNGGIPPAVVVEDVIGGGEVETGAASLEGENEEFGAGGLFELGDHAVAVAAGGAAVEEVDFFAEGGAEVGGEELTHFGELGEDEGLFAGLADLFEHFGEAGEFAAAAGEGAFFLEDLGGVVADLFEAGDGGEDEAAALHAGAAFEIDEAAVDDVFVEAALFAGELAVGFELELFGEVGDDGAIGFEAAEDEGGGEGAQLFHGALVLILLDGFEEAMLEVAGGAEQTGVEELHEGVEIADVIFDGGASEGDAEFGGEVTHGAGLFGVEVLDVLGFVEDDAVPGDFGKGGLVAMDEGVAGEDEIVLGGEGGEVLAAWAMGAVVEVDLELGEELGGLALPVAKDGGGADEEDGAAGQAGAALVAAGEQGEELDGFAEAHVVGQASAEAEVREEIEPGVATALVGAEFAGEAGGSGEVANLGGVAEAIDEAGDPAFSAEVGKGDAEDFAQGVAGGEFAGGAIAEEAEGIADAGGVDAQPAAAELLEFAGAAGEFLQFFHGDGLVAEESGPVQTDFFVEGLGRGGGFGRGGEAAGEIDAEAVTGAPPGGVFDAEAGAFEHGGVALEEVEEAFADEVEAVAGLGVPGEEQGAEAGGEFEADPGGFRNGGAATEGHAINGAEGHGEAGGVEVFEDREEEPGVSAAGLGFEDAEREAVAEVGLELDAALPIGESRGEAFEAGLVAAHFGEGVHESGLPLAVVGGGGKALGGFLGEAADGGIEHPGKGGFEGLLAGLGDGLVFVKNEGAGGFGHAGGETFEGGAVAIEIAGSPAGRELVALAIDDGQEGAAFFEMEGEALGDGPEVTSGAAVGVGGEPLGP